MLIIIKLNMILGIENFGKCIWEKLFNFILILYLYFVECLLKYKLLIENSAIEMKKVSQSEISISHTQHFLND